MKTREEKVYQAIGHIVMIVLSLNVIIPMLLLVISSLTDNNALISHGYSFLPKKMSIYAYQYIFRTGNAVIRAYGISILLTAVGTLLSVAITTLLAYALSRRDLPGRSVLAFYVFFTMLFNGGLVPTYMNYTNTFGIKNTFWSLLIPGLVTNGFYILLMKSYFVSSVPGEILEAAEIDGASAYQIFGRIALPLAKPIVATIGLFAAIGYWNDWQNGYIYLTKRTDLYSIQNLLNRMIENIQYLSQNASNIRNADVGLAAIPSVSIRMAMAVVGILPILVIYPFVQSSFVKGITLGGIKG